VRHVAGIGAATGGLSGGRGMALA